jgi:hypothetical protein
MFSCFHVSFFLFQFYFVMSGMETYKTKPVQGKRGRRGVVGSMLSFILVYATWSFPLFLMVLVDFFSFFLNDILSFAIGDFVIVRVVPLPKMERKRCGSAVLFLPRKRLNAFHVHHATSCGRIVANINLHSFLLRSFWPANTQEHDEQYPPFCVSVACSSHAAAWVWRCATGETFRILLLLACVGRSFSLALVLFVPALARPRPAARQREGAFAIIRHEQFGSEAVHCHVCVPALSVPSCSRA